MSPTPSPLADLERLEDLRSLAAREPNRARSAAWEWFRELQVPANHPALPWLFAHGTPSAAPDGDCEGLVMRLFGSPWLVLLDRMVRLGQLLGGIGWTGKSFDRERGTGYNRLTRSSRLAALLVLPTYRFEQIGGELIGFRFRHALETSPVEPKTQVLSIRYDDPAHANPLILPRTRDELVEIVPGVFLGRALLNGSSGWEVVAYFGLRHPRPGRA